MSDRRPTIPELFDDGTAIDEALREAARDARRFHKAIGNPMATWRDGKVVWIQPEVESTAFRQTKSMHPAWAGSAGDQSLGVVRLGQTVHRVGLRLPPARALHAPCFTGGHGNVRSSS
jgi:hypothetical protein